MNYYYKPVNEKINNCYKIFLVLLFFIIIIAILTLIIIFVTFKSENKIINNTTIDQKQYNFDIFFKNS